MALVYNQLKINKINKRNNDIKNTIFRRESLGQINVPNPVPNQMNNMPNSSKNIDVFNKINNP